MMKKLILLILLLNFSYALEISNLEEVESKMFNIGTIGPGQTIDLKMNPIVTKGGIYGEGGYYDYAIAEVPNGWRYSESKLYANPMHLTVTADKNAKEGEYTIKIIVIDEYNSEKLGNLSFYIKVNIEKEVVGLKVSPEKIITSPNQPAVFNLIIENKGSVSDVFEVGAKGPQRWNFRKFVLIPPQESKVIRYEIVGEEEEKYTAEIYVKSTASDQIYLSKNVEIEIRPTVLGDIEATTNGLIIYPIFNLPIQALANLIALVIE